MPDITFLTFNFGNAGRYANGPGICLSNFVKDLRKAGLHIEVFSIMPSWDSKVNSFNDINKLNKSIKSSKIIHHWSGIFPEMQTILNNCNSQKILIGPNVVDGEDAQKEYNFLSKTKYSNILVVNKRIKFKIQKEYKIKDDFVQTLTVGPDQEIWSPSNVDNGKILWKGNCTHKIKDIDFALQVSKKLTNYEFQFIGYPKPYDYLEHIDLAKQCHLYFTTSISETMGLALCESWASGIPSVSHPKIEIIGENYSTGIITNRTVDDYCKSITEIMENQDLYNHLKIGAVNFIKEKFSNTANEYIQRYLS